ncbi:MAG: hypothetical protein QG559_1563 [Campylobacterota bacterium]|nr:hypothetical protein [Campylobacterota bacterium]
MKLTKETLKLIKAIVAIKPDITVGEFARIVK